MSLPCGVKTVGEHLLTSHLLSQRKAYSRVVLTGRYCSAGVSGLTQASPLRAAFPLVDAGFTKDDVRAWSQHLGLRTWDKPAAACLASRVPYGTEVSVPILGRIERAEAALHALGFAQCRVRHYDDTARVEVEVGRLDEVLARRQQVVAAIKAAGYRYVTIDLEGFRSGNLNAALGVSRPRG